MGTSNANWHATHRMLKNQTAEQRIEWHLAHDANCSCRTPPPGVIAPLLAKGITLPSFPPSEAKKQLLRRASKNTARDPLKESSGGIRSATLSDCFRRTQATATGRLL